MTTAQDNIKKTGDFIRNSVTLKMTVIGLLIIILMIPVSMVSSVMRERESRRSEVITEINQKWGNSQTITGPFITVPYKSFYLDHNNKPRYTLNYLHILPEKLTMAGEMVPQIRYRSLFEAILYNSRISINGILAIPDLKSSNIDPAHVLWDKAALSIGITDMRGIKKNIDIRFNEKTYTADPGLETADIASSGVRCHVPMNPSTVRNTFSFQLDLNGSETLQFIPLGETTTVDLKSSWPSPSFSGAFLPEKREVSDKGFTAHWNILHLNRNFPQFWTGNQYTVGDSAFGLKLLITADIYQKSIRVAKYAVMFIVFTFAAFFLAEIISRKRIHPIQYILIGLAVILFYVLLLSISEHLNFNIAYILSAMAITFLITGYARGILRDKRFTMTLFSILTVLYAYLFIVIQLEDYALIMGSMGLFAVLSTVMYITRNINWYALGKRDGGV